MINLKEQVRVVLRSDPETRNSDITLTIRIWQRFYGVNDLINVYNLYDLPREDNVKRIRAKFCEQRKDWAYPTSLKIAKRRGIKEEEWRQALGYPPTDETIYSTRKESYLSDVKLPPPFNPEKIKEVKQGKLM